MARDTRKIETLSWGLIAFSVTITFLYIYWIIAPILALNGIRFSFLEQVILLYKEYFMSPYKIKGLAFLLLVCSTACRSGKKSATPIKTIIIYCVIGPLLFFIPFKDPVLQASSMLVGLFLGNYGFSLLIRNVWVNDEPDDDEGFDQTRHPIVTKDSINIPYVFTYKKKSYKGWINCINPYRASMVLGSPGSGKSFAFYNAFIEQTLRKGFTMFLYDYKFPDLTERVITEVAYQKQYEGLWKNMKVKPHMYIINFDDPMKSNRCNPIHHSYITDPADTTEIADLVFKNINKGTDGKGFDFFNESAKVYLDALVWFLANYDPDALYDDEGNVIGSTKDYQRKGCYCTFPHVIELMAYNYQKTFQILQFTRGLEAKISPFASALEGGAMEQLQGQIASAQIPMGKFVSPALYWVMTGDDFTLDINNPEEPKIVCMGNNPDRQTIYGTTLALYTSRMFKLINHKKKLKSVVLLDELPTVFIKGLDNLIATARSNKVAIVLGAQDKSQLRRDYGEKEAEVIMSTVGNVFSGSVEGKTAESISKAFGKEFRQRVSQSLGDETNSRSVSYQLEEILPASKIMDMSQGTFCGWVKDNFSDKIKRKKFHGEVTVDAKRNEKLDDNAQKVPVITKLFGDTMPEMPDRDRERLKKMYPKISDNESALKTKYIDELTQVEVQKNFKKIKEDIRRIVEKEYERTIPLAEEYRRQMQQNEEE